MRIVPRWEWLNNTHRKRVHQLDVLYGGATGDENYQEGHVFIVGKRRLLGFAFYRTSHEVRTCAHIGWFVAPRHGRSCLAKLLAYLDTRYLSQTLYNSKEPAKAYAVRKNLYKNAGFNTTRKSDTGTFMRRVRGEQ
jgi:hypothetical protein